MTGLRLDRRTTSAAAARQAVRDGLASAGLSEDDVFDAALIASELVSNAIRHGGPSTSGLRLDWSVGAGSYRIAVTTDDVGQRIEPRSAADTEVDGRGLTIVAALADSWGVDTDDGSTTVWATGSISEARSTVSVTTR